MATFTPSSAASATEASTASPATVNVQIYHDEPHFSLIRIWNGNVSETHFQICMFSGQNYDPNILAAEVDKAKTRTASSNDVFTMPLSKVPICDGEERYILRISPNPKDPGFFKRLISALQTLEQSMVSEQTACSNASEQTACSSASVASPDAEFAPLIEGVKKATLKRLIADWQCCHGCNNGCAFPFGNEDTAIMVNFILRNGGTVLCADFALKSLINQGIDVFQGVKPFAQTGEIARRGFTDDGLYKLRFDSKKLLDCGSPQLQAIATMNANGKVIVNFMPCTIQYDILPGAYSQLQSLGCEMTVLTRVCTCETSRPPKKSRMSFPSSAVVDDDSQCIAMATTVKEVPQDICTCVVPADLNEGMKNVGHTMIKFPSGGVCFVANCHWGNLKPDNSDVSQEGLTYMTQTYGASFTQEFAESPANLQLDMLVRVMSSRTPSCN
jgi:hypothetical protein